MLLRSLFLASILAAAVPAQLRIYIAPDDHTDLWWSADEATYNQVFASTLDYYLNQIDATATNPSQYQGRWNCDGSYWMWVFEHNRSTAQFQRLIDRIGDGHISVPLNGLAVCLGGAPAEAILRGMYYPGHIERRYGVHFPLAYTMENQTQPLGLWSLFSGAGARFFWKGICGCNTFNPNAWDRPHDIYWGTGLDGSQVLVKWNTLWGSNMNMGGYAEARDPTTTVNFVSSDPNFQSRYPYSVIGCFGKGWDDLQTQTGEFITVAQATTNATRSVRVSNEADFFQDFEATYGTLIPSESVTYGNEWDLHCAALAEVTARVRRAVEKLRSAEALAVLAGRNTPGLLAGREAARDQAWMDLGLYWEHNFGMDGFGPNDPLVIGRIAWQRRLATEIETYVDGLQTAAAAALGELLPNGTGSRFFVANQLGSARTDFVEVPWSGASNVHVVDVAAQTDEPSQVLTRGTSTYLRWRATGVPAVGYRVYDVVNGPGQSFTPAATVATSGANRVLDNGVLRVTVTPSGAISSLIDLQHGNREFVAAVGGLLANDLGNATAGSIAVENQGPASVSVRVTAPQPLPHTVVVTMYRDSDRVEIVNSIDSNFDATQTWAFGFNLDQPILRYEEVGNILRADLAPVGNYSTRGARYDWQTLNHFADMTSATAGVGITLANADCSFMKFGNSTLTSLDTATPRLEVLAGGHGLGSPYGLQNQGGDASFLQRFWLRPHQAYDQAAAMRMALEAQNPLLGGAVTGARALLPVGPYGMISISDPNVLLWAFKPAEEGFSRGLIARTWNVSETPRTATVQLQQGNVRAAWVTTHIETDTGSLPVTNNGVQLAYQPQQIRSVRLDTSAQAICTAFGSGCTGPGGTLSLQPATGSLPVLGETLTLELRGYQPADLTLLLLGFSNQQWALGALPANLQPFGFGVGCMLLCSPDTRLFLFGANGVATWSAPLANNISLMGLQLHAQGLELATSGSTLGWVSNGLSLRLGYR